MLSFYLAVGTSTELFPVKRKTEPAGILLPGGAKNEAPASRSGLRPPFWGLLFDTPTRDAETGPSSRSPIGLLLRRDRQKAEDSLEVELLLCRVRVMVLRLVWASRLGEALAKTEDLSKPEWCFVRCLQFGRDLEELAHGVRPGHADILVLEYEEIEIPRPGLFLPRSAQVQLGRCLLNWPDGRPWSR